MQKSRKTFPFRFYNVLDDELALCDFSCGASEKNTHLLNWTTFELRHLWTVVWESFTGEKRR